ncbi:hypothetical protein QO951_004326 [Salmonella enterica]|nr:hypothetical protein [Salmonella enterica]EFA3283559.1 hypothetical protein [Salmonella enterica]EIY5380644.1 hypothetical protein [Salmonella enterica]ELS7530257.1 hypothetical protein [Salmonella enterica]
MTTYTLKQARPSDGELGQLWKLYHAADRVTDRWHCSTVGPIAEELANTELSREEKMFLLRAWQVLVDGHCGYSRLMGAFDCYVYNVQDPAVTHVAYKPSLVEQLAAGELLDVLLEAYAEAQARIDELEARTISVKLPDPSSKAFWGGAGKNETFYPSTYKIWVKESIERAGAIAQVAVKVV